MLVAVTATPGANHGNLLESVAEECGLEYIEEETLIKQCADYCSIERFTYTELLSWNVANYRLFHEFAMNRLQDGDKLTTYRMAALTDPMCMKVLLYCNPTKAAEWLYGKDEDSVLDMEDHDTIMSMDLFQKNLYNVAEYDVTIDVSYMMMSEVVELLTALISEYRKGRFKSRVYLCTRDIHPTDRILPCETDSNTEIRVGLVDGDFKCIGDHAGYFAAVQSGDNVIRVDEFIQVPDVNELPEREFYMIEDDFDITYPPSGLCKLIYRRDSNAIIERYIAEHPIKDVPSHKQLEALQEAVGIRDPDKLVDYMLDRGML